MAWKEYYHHYDGQGNTTCLTDESETEVVRYVNTAFGERLDVVGDPTLTPFQWNGRWGYYYDEDLGKYHVRARPYEPAVARWLSVDPQPLSYGVMSLYCYSENQPTNQSDPSGLFPPLGTSCPPYHVTCQRPGFTFTPDGCSVPQWAVDTFKIKDKDRPKGGALFGPACNQHDVCYHDCFKTRKECDDQFKADLLAACQAAANDPELRAVDFSISLCNVLATLYYGAVSEAGDSPNPGSVQFTYADDQAAACCCCSSCDLSATSCVEPVGI